MKTEHAIEYFNGIAALAKALTISRQAIYQWGECVPELRALQLERITEGELSAYDNALYSQQETPDEQKTA